MGNFYTAPERKGNSPYTRSGVAPPKLIVNDKPAQHFNNPMSLELHMADERVRATGLTPSEREWRKKWLHDQALHPDEPIAVDAVNRILNPVRILYRWPWDKLYLHFLKPTFGVYHGTAIRMFVPKLIMGFITLQTIYYLAKYRGKPWDQMKGVEVIPSKTPASKTPTLEEVQVRLRKSFNDRTGLLDVGETRRPW